MREECLYCKHKHDCDWWYYYMGTPFICNHFQLSEDIDNKDIDNKELLND